MGCLVVVGPAKFLFSLTPFSLLFSLYCVSAGIPFVLLVLMETFFSLCNFKLPSLPLPIFPFLPLDQPISGTWSSQFDYFFFFFSCIIW